MFIKYEKRLKTGGWIYIIFTAALIMTALLCISVGSVSVPIKEIAAVFADSLFGIDIFDGFSANSQAIIMNLRTPRAILTLFVGAALAVSGAAMQGIIENPLADGSALGITAGGSLGAVLVISFGLTLPSFPELTITVSAIIFSMISLLIVIKFAHSADNNLSSNTIILAGIIFSMLVNSMITLITSFSGDKAKSILFWTMGSFSGRSWDYVLIAVIFITIGLTGILLHCRELDAFAMGGEQSQYVGVNVKAVRIRLLILVSILCGTAVSLVGNIAFVGLVIPHILRMVVGPMHIKLIPASVFGGAIFVALSDLIARTVLSPVEIPVGAVTSIIGSVTFIYIFYKSGKNAV